MNWLHNFFRPVAAADVLARQLFEAERLHAEHQAAAEMHAALAAVYRIRVERIRRGQPTELKAVR